MTTDFLTYAVTPAEWLHQPGYPALFILSFLASTLLPVGSEWLLALMLVKGYPVATTVATATTGNCLGAITTWMIGMYGGEWLIGRVLRISPPELEKARGYYQKYGIFSLFFSWLPIIGDPLCLIAGIMRINFWPFLLLVSSGKLIRYLVTAWLTLWGSGQV